MASEDHGMSKLNKIQISWLASPSSSTISLQNPI